MIERSLEDLDLNAILALHWLLEEESISKAADRLGLTQPGMSRVLARLRADFGDPLLVRAGRRMVRTKAANALRPRLADAISGLRTALRPPLAFSPSEAGGDFRIACTDYVGVMLATAWRERVAPEAPQLGLDLRALTQTSMTDIFSGGVDLIALPDLALESAARHTDIDQFVRREIHTEKFVSVVHPAHPAAGAKLSAKEFAALDHVLVSPTGSGPGVIDTLLSQRNLTRRIAYRVQNFLAALELVRMTDCIATLPQGLVNAVAQDLVTVPTAIDAGGFKLVAAWPPDRTKDGAHAWVRNRLFDGLDTLN